MKKRIIAASLLLATPLAMAEATIYGSVRASVEYDKITDAKTTANNFSKVRLTDQSSRLGFKGTEALQNGYTFLWQVESRPKIGNATDNNSDLPEWGTRNTFIAVKDKNGAMLMAGRYDDLIDQTMGDFYRGVDCMDETSDGIVTVVRRGATKVGQNLEYYSQDFNGLKFKAQYDFGRTYQTVHAYGAAGSVMYNHKLFDVGVAIKRNKNTMGATASAYNTVTDANIVEGNYYQTAIVGANLKIIDGLNLSAAFNRVKRKSVAAKLESEQDSFGGGLTYEFGKYRYGLSAGMLMNGKANGKTVESSRAYAAGLGMQYLLSKNIRLQEGLYLIKNGVNAGSSMTTALTNGTGVTGGAGAKIIAIGSGVRVDF